MTDTPIWPGVGEYLYQAATPGAVLSDGTRMAPLAVTPRCRSPESTPMAGISTDTGGERRSHGPRAKLPVVPAAAADGCGACTWDSSATPTASRPLMISTTPSTPATRARGRTNMPGGGPCTPWGHETTTRRPAIR